MAGEIIASTSFTPAFNSKRTGKWSPAPANFGSGALRCTGKCTASISTKGQVSVITAEGSSEVFITGKSVLKNLASQTNQFSKTIDLGKTNKVLRVSGRNFIFSGIANTNIQFSDFQPLSQLPEILDPSLIDQAQLELSRIGFSSNDFVQGWTVLPMARGTTLLDPTLDLCGSDYKSESGRVVRRQVMATKVGSPYSFLSTETVRYRNSAAALLAYEELRQKFKDCVKNKGVIENGIFTPYEIQELQASNKSEKTDIKRLLVKTVIGTGPSARQLLGFYQYKNDTFSGLYVSTLNGKPFDPLAIKRWELVADQLSQRL